MKRAETGGRGEIRGVFSALTARDPALVARNDQKQPPYPPTSPRDPRKPAEVSPDQGRTQDDGRPGQPASQDIAPADRFGPFADGLEPAERLARLRSMRAIVNLTTGPRGDALARELHLAERDPARLPAAVAALDRLAALDRRHVLASFARLYRAD